MFPSSGCLLLPTQALHISFCPALSVGFKQQQGHMQNPAGKASSTDLHQGKTCTSGAELSYLYLSPPAPIPRGICLPPRRGWSARRTPMVACSHPMCQHAEGDPKIFVISLWQLTEPCDPQPGLYLWLDCGRTAYIASSHQHGSAGTSLLLTSCFCILLLSLSTIPPGLCQR